MKRDSMKQDHKDKALREHVLYLLDGGGAHAKFDEVVADIPPKLLGQKPAGLPHSLWRLLEHLRIAQRDILEFSRNPKYVAPKWPEGYWPKTEGPPSPAAWNASVKKFRQDLKAMQDLVKDPQDRSVCENSVGRRADRPPRSPAAGRSQRVPSGADVGRSASIGGMARELSLKFATDYADKHGLTTARS